jgi:hypothetical protein
MILTKNIEVKIISSIVKYYKCKGYHCNIGETISVKIEDIPKNSHLKIKVECDICKKENNTTYNNYTKLINKYNTYRCKECGINHRKMIFIEKYGVDNPTKSKCISSKISSCYKSKSEEEKIKIKEKQKKTFFEKYGDWFIKGDLYKEKVKITSLANYGTDDYRSSESFKNKVKETLFIKYGVKNAFELEKSYNKAWFGNKINGIHLESEIKYQGTYELDFIEKYYQKLQIEKIDPIEYLFENTKRRYYPDFYIKSINLIIEVKSTYTYNYELHKNLTKKEASIKKGFNFIFIIDKDYTEFENLLKKLSR